MLPFAIERRWPYQCMVYFNFIHPWKKTVILRKKAKIKEGPLRSSYISLVAGEEGIEPSLTVLETAVLPLNHSPIMPKFYAWH